MKKLLFTLKNLMVASTCLWLSACGSLLDKDNTPTPTPLTNVKQELNVHEKWNTRANSGVGTNYLRLIPTTNHQAIFTASENGSVTATNMQNGQLLWKYNTSIKITSGTGADDSLVVVGGSNGEVIALHSENGHLAWKTTVPTEILAAPAVNTGAILIKTVDGRLFALSSQDGHILWRYQQTEPSLILRVSSSPIISNNNAIVGFANGNLAKLSLREGNLLWEQMIAAPTGLFAIQRMVDIDATPLVLDHHIYTATYQGKIASLDFTTGRVLWSHDISSYTGMAADAHAIYVSDTQSHVWAFDAQTGAVLWRQTQLAARNITGPAAINQAVVVGDGEGYLHWLNKQDGHFVARVKTDHAGILAAPLVDHDSLYVFTRNGYLSAYTIQ